MSWPNGIVLLDHGFSDADASVYTTNSFTFPANTLVLAFSLVDGPGAATPSNPTITRHTGGAAITSPSVVTDASAGLDYRISCRRMAEATGFTDSLDFTSDQSPDMFAWCILAVYNVPHNTGSNGADAIVQSTSTIVGTTGTAATLNLVSGLAKTSNLVIGCVAHNGSGAQTAGQTKLSEEINSSAPQMSLLTCYRTDGTGTLSSSWTGSTAWGELIIEVRTIDTQVTVMNATAS